MFLKENTYICSVVAMRQTYWGSNDALAWQRIWSIHCAQATSLKLFSWLCVSTSAHTGGGIHIIQGVNWISFFACGQSRAFCREWSGFTPFLTCVDSRHDWHRTLKKYCHNAVTEADTQRNDAKDRKPKRLLGKKIAWMGGGAAWKLTINRRHCKSLIPSQSSMSVCKRTWTTIIAKIKTNAKKNRKTP